MKIEFNILMLALFCAANVAAQNAPSSGQNTKTSQKIAQSTNEVSDVTIAKELANPVSRMTSVPFQWNYNPVKSNGPSSAFRQSLLVQPAIPVALSGGDALVFRPIITGEFARQSDGTSIAGLGNVQIETFYAPRSKSSLMWGVGPYLELPTDAKYGSQQTGLGFTGVVLSRAGSWTYGGLMFRSWSVGGSSTSGTVNNIYFQPFVSHITPSAFTFSLNVQPNYNFDSHNTVTPVIFTVSKSHKLGGVHVQLSAGTSYTIPSVVGAQTGWGFRAGMTLVLPKKSK